MSILLWIFVVTFAGGILSVAVAALFAFKARGAQVVTLISYAVGALLGAVFLEVLPAAFQMTGSIKQVSATVLLGILLFFVLEKLVLWRHCHEEECAAHITTPVGGDHGRSGMMITIGDTFHNFVDGCLIAAAFLADVQLGLVTATAIIAHEIPQEVGDFLVLLHSGYTKTRALLLNMLTSLSMVAGGVIAYFALETMQQSIPYLLALAAASMLYVSVADLIPGLHRRPEMPATVQQVALIGAGVATIWGVGELLH